MSGLILRAWFHVQMLRKIAEEGLRLEQRSQLGQMAQTNSIEGRMQITLVAIATYLLIMESQRGMEAVEEKRGCSGVAVDLIPLSQSLTR